MRFGLYIPDYRGFWASACTGDRYISHMAFGLKNLGHDVTIYASWVPPWDTMISKQLETFDTRDIDVILTHPKHANLLSEKTGGNIPIFTSGEAVEVGKGFPSVALDFVGEGIGYYVPTYGSLRRHLPARFRAI